MKKTRKKNDRIHREREREGEKQRGNIHCEKEKEREGEIGNSKHEERRIQYAKFICDKGIQGGRFPRGTSPQFRYNVENVSHNVDTFCIAMCIVYRVFSVEMYGICTYIYGTVLWVFQYICTLFNALLFDCLIILMKNGNFM